MSLSLSRFSAFACAGACTAVFLTALASDAVPSGSGGDPAAAGGFEQRKATYSNGSTIHYGQRMIDVSPHRVWSLAQTDDGFVFATESGHQAVADWEARGDTGSAERRRRREQRADPT